jgi:hypothetical protein
MVAALMTTAVFCSKAGEGDANCDADGNATTDNGIDIYLCMGQSNMAGATIVTTDYTVISDAYIYNATANEWVAPSNNISDYNLLGDMQNGKIGVYYGFLLDMVNYYPDRKTAIVLAAYGGRDISCFLPGNSSGYYQAAVAAAKAASAMSGGTVRAVLWHQGENDSDASMRPFYEGKLKTLTTALRKDLNLPSLPFVAGEVMEDTSRETYANYRAFNAELNRIASSSVIPYLYVVQSDGLTTGQDPWHFNIEGIVTLGQRYAAMVHSILSGTPD